MNILVRRTAEIALFSPDDEDCLKAKSNLQVGYEHRYMSNNSMFVEEKPDKETLIKMFEEIRKFGEPGIINAEAGRERREDFDGVNPCVLGETLILTKEYGNVAIREVVDEEVTVWNGYEWSVVTPRVTGYNQPILEVSFSNGSKLKCTDYHEFVMNGGERKKAKDLLVGEKLEKFELPTITDEYDLFSDRNYVRGFYSGDGVCSKPIIWLYDKKRKLANEFEKRGCRVRKGQDRDVVYIPFPVSKNQVPLEFISIENKLEWLAGLLDSDGAVNSQDGSLAISSINVEFLEKVKSLLTTLGVHSCISFNRKGGTKMIPANNGTNEYREYECQDCYRLTISAWNTKHLIDLGLKTYRLELKANPNRNASSFITITDVRRVENAPVVYCFTEPKNHTGVFNGIMTGQCGEVLLPSNAVCNLTTINLTQFVERGKRGESAVKWSELKKAIRLSARAGYRMTCLNLELPHWNEVHHRDRLLGCSMTGYQDFIAEMPEGFNKKLFLTEMHYWTRFYAEEYAKELGTPKSLLVTAVKPEGSLSLLANGVSAGVHYQHSPYFIRRVRVNASDPLAQTALKLGWRINPEVGQTMESATTLVIDFPCKTPATRTKFDVSAVEQLEEYIMFQKNYTEQNTSNTITVKPEEWGEVVDYVYSHWDDILGVSFLEVNSTYYPLMPYEECTKEEYEELKASMKEFDPDILNNLEISTRNYGQEFEILDDRAECASGVCPIR